MKRHCEVKHIGVDGQPPSGGCVLKTVSVSTKESRFGPSPPSGRPCVKQRYKCELQNMIIPAAFGRPCKAANFNLDAATAICRPKAAFRRLCGESGRCCGPVCRRAGTSRLRAAIDGENRFYALCVTPKNPAAFGRLCETAPDFN